MKYLKKPLWLLLFIVIIGTFIRTYQLGNVPQSLNWDEVSLGYNAYSILHTGKDEFGKTLPLVMRSFDDYKPALYAYFTIPFVALLGLTEQAVRLPSVVAGVIAIIVVYFLVNELLGKRKITVGKSDIHSQYIALLASFLLAISPWHIQFSRIAYESNVGLTLNLVAFLLFLKGLKNSYLLPISFLIAALNIHVYQSERVFSPLLMIALSLIWHKQLLLKKKWVVISILTAVIVSLPLLIYILTNQNALMRAKGVSVFSSQNLIDRSSKKLVVDVSTNNIAGLIMDNRRVEFGKAIVNGYISHFDLNWLFVTGDLARHHAPFMGLLYLFELPFMLIGIYLLVFLKIDSKYKIAFFSYFLLVPIPASITSGVPHAVRTLNFAWTWELFIALGIVGVTTFLMKIKSKPSAYLIKIGALVYIFLTIINVTYYFNQYFVQLNYYHAYDWLYGYKQAIAYVDGVRNNYDKIVVENEVPFDQSYMFFLFYLKVDPSYYQSMGGTKSGGFKEEHKGFYNITFRPVKDDNQTGKILYVGKPGDIDGSFKNRKVIVFPDGAPAIAIGEK